MAAQFLKEKICSEDIVLSLDSEVLQTRGKLTPFNAFSLPYSVEEISVGVALNARPTLKVLQNTFAKLGGAEDVAFKVYPAVNPSEAINKAQLEEYLEAKSDKDNVLELDNSDAYTPLTDYNPATKRYVDAKFLNGASGTFTSADGKTITVSAGLITEIL